MRESDGVHFLWNGEGCIRVSPAILGITGADETPIWHNNYGEIPGVERKLLEAILEGRYRMFDIKGHGRYQVIARGEFRDSQ